MAEAGLSALNALAPRKAAALYSGSEADSLKVDTVADYSKVDKVAPRYLPVNLPALRSEGTWRLDR